VAGWHRVFGDQLLLEHSDGEVFCVFSSSIINLGRNFRSSGNFSCSIHRSSVVRAGGVDLNLSIEF
jgi:hypothetical protein